MKKIMFLLVSMFLFSACIPGKQADTTIEALPTNSADKEVTQQMDSTESVKDVMVKDMDSETEEKMMEVMSLYTLSGELADVSGGNSSGTAKAGFIDESYNLYATFNDLPTPGENFFYEGWVVRKSPFAFISTGELNNNDGVYSNTYSSGTDYSEYDFYVLTLEPTDDGENGKPDPAPAAHILEGVMELLQQ
jgi:hypothetical protein